MAGWLGLSWLDAVASCKGCVFLASLGLPASLGAGVPGWPGPAWPGVILPLVWGAFLH